MELGRRHGASTGASPSAHVYAAPGNYTITLTTTDGWGDVRLDHPQREPGRARRQHGTARRRSRPAARRTPPAPSTAPETVDAQGDVIRYAWTFGDTGTSTSANPSRTYAAPGTYTVTLTATDVWGKSTTVSARRDHDRAGRQHRARPRRSSATCTDADVCDEQHRDGRPGGSHDQGVLVELG